MTDAASGDGRGEIIRATAVAIDGWGVLIFGKSGSGKSTLALMLMAQGALLIGDDGVFARVDGQGALILDRPQGSTRGVIEARGVGLLKAPIADLECPAGLAVDLDQEETERLPPRRTRTLLGVTLPCLYKVDGPGFPAAICHHVRYGRAA